MSTIENVSKAAQLMRDAMSLLAAGPLDFYLRELVAAHEMLMTRFAPFKVGDRVVLIKAPDYEKAPGWKHCAHFLVPGALGTVAGAKCGERGFRFDVIFDNESWVDTVGFNNPIGTAVPIDKDKRHMFGCSEGSLAKYVP